MIVYEQCVRLLVEPRINAWVVFFDDSRNQLNERIGFSRMYCNLITSDCKDMTPNFALVVAVDTQLSSNSLTRSNDMDVLSHSHFNAMDSLLAKPYREVLFRKQKQIGVNNGCILDIKSQLTT